MKSALCVITAVKKNVAFPDDLIKRLGEKSLIQLTIDKAISLRISDILVLTDSQEIIQIAKFNGLDYVYDSKIDLETSDFTTNLKNHISREYDVVLFLSPYTPLVLPNEISSALSEFATMNGFDALVSVREESYFDFTFSWSNLKRFLSDRKPKSRLIEVSAFKIVRMEALQRSSMATLKCFPYLLSTNTLEIKSHQDWWVCEKLLRRKRIVFRIIGDSKIGMGHVYRSLAIAHSISDHEVIFVTSEKCEEAIKTITSKDYDIYSYPELQIAHNIIHQLQPDLVINDILSTDFEYVNELKKSGIRVLNFEDLGPGAEIADMVVNELFEPPPNKPSQNTRWGYQFYFLRNEFEFVSPNIFKEQVGSILLTFGGSDPNNLTCLVLKALTKIKEISHIDISVIIGPSFKWKSELDRLVGSLGLNARVDIFENVSTISEQMANSDIAICSNGRTTFELAYMNIPSIVICQNIREETHNSMISTGGFINLGLYGNDTENRLISNLLRLVRDTKYRKSKFESLKELNFEGNLSRVTSLIEGLL
ncbi:glycosyltransferase [Pseudobacteriovorax antillogorgiicola]|uniref:Spore coat polysaccharide biosynthesis protein SpsG, predicted glycosyltransferase n=1 Tax=Pseudobacteriovorax antillogorgiicola TaxID=1513793 RepID=A0A1Y6CLZ9_9BACT|nr:glycosyltransferase [Pseudobacteriovorax antillogorgiicola]TCS45188.1 spore coat polysaccharide biosynthesis predicted glycosyltransferase SpsG [Pseudobacteriovorax antillogorgiicola]SMF75644.1 Spore coat polysaccharide biosynthesis protein SpsG, predicted glycosyltransferase [Pseudobacteriovorax antillogorgiicola]